MTEYTETPPLLEVRNLCIALDLGQEQKQILHDVSFRIERGEFVALMGKSGIGKSLTAKAILGFLNKPEWILSGQIDFYPEATAASVVHILQPIGEPTPQQEITTADSPEAAVPPARSEQSNLSEGEQRTSVTQSYYQIEPLLEELGKSITAIFQSPDLQLHPSLSIQRQIGETIDPRHPLSKEHGKEIDQRLQTVQIDSANRYAHQFSHGQKQRILLAMALHKGALLIADEPTSALDPQTKDKLIEVLKNVRNPDFLQSLLLITHDIEVVTRLFRETDRIFILETDETGSASITQRFTMSDISKSDATDTSKSPPESKPLPPLLAGHTLFRELALTRKPMQRTVLNIQNLSQRYRQGFWKEEKEILHDISLSVLEGEVIGIIGQSGCGKSTLVKAIARLLNQTKGEILYFNKNREPIDLIKLQPNGFKADTPGMHEIRKEFQVIFQDTASLFNPRMTIQEIMNETLEIKGLLQDSEARNEIVSTLVKLGISKSNSEAASVLRKYPREFSGGEKQRLAIARAYLMKPRLIIADEPFANQDPITTLEIITSLLKLNEDIHTSIILISHEVHIIHNICHRIYRLKEGVLIPEPTREDSKVE